MVASRNTPAGHSRNRTTPYITPRYMRAKIQLLWTPSPCNVWNNGVSGRVCPPSLAWRTISALPVRSVWVTRRRIGSKSKISDDEIPPTQEVMSDRSSASTRLLQTAILRSVSRSFYLSIRLLPAQLREPVALAYLLARTTDTVADTPHISGTLRVETLQTLSKAIQGKASRSVVVDLVASFAPLQQDAAERTLVESLPDCLEALEHLEMADHKEIRALLEKITQGQMLDLQRFDNPEQIRALRTVADLDEYTYLVAGCVGEFWTRLCFRHVQNFARLSEDEMLALGKRYGMTLQLINVLRDAGSDLRAGRCYFPEYELNAAHLATSQILSELERFQPI